MNHYFLALIAAFVCLSTFNFLESQEIIETSTIDDVLPLVDEETWFLVDLDNTLFQAKQALGHVNWLQHEVQKLIGAGKSREDAFHSVYPLWKKTQIMTEVTPVESNFVEAIKQLQNRNIIVMGLTHRQLFIVPETLRQLNSIGVSFEPSAPSQETFNISANQPALFTQGILFVDDFNTKGDIFRLLLQQLGKKPKKIVFIDDKKKNVEEFAQATLSEEIEYVGVYYTAVEQEPQIYSTELAEYQLRFLNAIMSNEQALQLLSQETESQEIQSSDPEFLYKIVSKKQWQESLLRNEVVSSPLDSDFIHLTTEEQVTNVIQKFWNNKDYIILKLTSNKLVGVLINETNPGGTNKYYHLYNGSIPLEAVKDVTIFNINNQN